MSTEKLPVRAVRVMLRMTKQEMADYLGLSYGGYAKKESGERVFSYEEIDKIHELSKIPIERIDGSRKGNA